MTEEHVYDVEVRTLKPRFVEVKLKGVDAFTVTSSPDWWPESPGDKLSPQTLILSASASCYALSVFKAAGRMHFEVKDVSVDGTATMGEEDGIWRFVEMDLRAKITVGDESDRDKAKRASELAHKSCPIANSLKCPTKMTLEIVVA